MNEQIKACPFCEDTFVDVTYAPENGGHYHVGCFTCGADGPAGDTEVEAVRLWNAASDQLEALRNKVEVLNKNLIETTDRAMVAEVQRDEATTAVDGWKAEYVRIHQEAEAYRKTNETVFNESTMLKSELAELKAAFSTISGLMLSAEIQRDEARELAIKAYQWGIRWRNKSLKQSQNKSQQISLQPSFAEIEANIRRVFGHKAG